MEFAWHNDHVTSEWGSVRAPMPISQEIVFFKAGFKCVRVKKINSTEGIMFYVSIETQQG